MIRRLLILKTNFLDSADHCTGKEVVAPSMNSNVNHSGTRVVSFLMQLPLGIMLLLILEFFHLSMSLKPYFIFDSSKEKKCFFGIHDPLGLRYIFQLRVGLSSLRCHKNRHNFIDTPSDICLYTQGIEDTNHSLFLCPFLLL